MDMETLKGEDRISLLRKETISLYEKLKEVGGALNELTTKRSKSKRDELFVEFEEMFTESGFSLEKRSFHYIATYNDVVAILREENPESNEDMRYVDFNVRSKSIYSTIVIQPNSETIGMIEWKHYLKTPKPDNRFIDSETYKDRINSIDSEEWLEHLISKIKENIEWYQQSINQVEKIKYVYVPYKTNKEFDSFVEYFKDIKPIE